MCQSYQYRISVWKLESRVQFFPGSKLLIFMMLCGFTSQYEIILSKCSQSIVFGVNLLSILSKILHNVILTGNICFVNTAFGSPLRPWLTTRMAHLLPPSCTLRGGTRNKRSIADGLMEIPKRSKWATLPQGVKETSRLGSPASDATP